MKEIKEMSQKYNLAKIYQSEIMGTYYNFKLLESFLEGAPQSMLQLVIIFQTKSCQDTDSFDEKIDPSTWFSIAVSFVSFTLTAAGIYTQHPTEVKIYTLLRPYPL